MQWSPRVKICFSDEELIQNLVITHDRPERRMGNWWTFFSQLCRHEQDQLTAESERRWSSTFFAHPQEPSPPDEMHQKANSGDETIQILSQIVWR